MRTLYALVLLAAAALTLLALYKLGLILLLGFLLAFLLDPLVDWLERRHCPRHWGALIVFVGLGVLLALIVMTLIPFLQQQLVDVAEHRGDYLAILKNRVDHLHELAVRYFPASAVEAAQAKAESLSVEQIQGLRNSIPAVLSWLSHLVFVPIVAFFFLVSGAEIKKWVISLLPNRYFEMTLMLLHEVNTQLGGYLRGQSLDCLINGFLYALGLFFLGVKGGLAIGAAAGIMNAVPYLGPILGSLPGMLSLMLDPNAVMPWWSVAILFLGVHLLDNLLIYPMTVGRSLDLPPFLVILGILFGGSIAGIPGMFLTVPLLGMARQAFVVFRSSLKSYRII